MDRNPEELEEMLKELDQSGVTLSHWEVEFTESVLSEPEKIATSERVRSTIENMYDKYMR